jgi:hypothetical protein
MCTRQSKPIVVHCNVWSKAKWFRHQGKTVRVSLLAEAREIVGQRGIVAKFR